MQNGKIKRSNNISKVTSHWDYSFIQFVSIKISVTSSFTTLSRIAQQDAPTLRVINQMYVISSTRIWRQSIGYQKTSCCKFFSHKYFGLRTSVRCNVCQRNIYIVRDISSNENELIYKPLSLYIFCSIDHKLL